MNSSNYEDNSIRPTWYPFQDYKYAKANQGGMGVAIRSLLLPEIYTADPPGAVFQTEQTNYLIYLITLQRYHGSYGREMIDLVRMVYGARRCCSIPSSAISSLSSCFFSKVYNI